MINFLHLKFLFSDPPNGAFYNQIKLKSIIINKNIKRFSGKNKVTIRPIEHWLPKKQSSTIIMYYKTETIVLAKYSHLRLHIVCFWP